MKTSITQTITFFVAGSVALFSAAQAQTSVDHHIALETETAAFTASVGADLFAMNSAELPRPTTVTLAAQTTPRPAPVVDDFRFAEVKLLPPMPKFIRAIRFRAAP